MNEKKYTVFFQLCIAPKSYQVEADTLKEAHDDAFGFLSDEVGIEEALEYECYAIKEET
tara:strand:- start:1436 stop:1612 length:177 start_codon:yes stop_codon:yes gene_type:complete